MKLEASKSLLRSRSRQLLQLLRDPLYANSSFLFANTVVGSGLGFAYWLVVAQLFNASEVGLGTALVAATRLLAELGSSGLGLGVIRFLSHHPKRRADALISGSLTFSVCAALTASIFYLLTLPLWSSKLAFLREPYWALAFVLSAGVWALAPIIDQIFLAHRAGGAVLGRHLVMHLAKLAIPFALMFAGGTTGVYASFTLGIAVSLGLGLGFLVFKLRPGYRLSLNFSALFRSREFLTYSVSNHIGNYLINLPSVVLPLIILNNIGETQAAYYYVAFMIASVLYSAATSLATSAFVEGSAQMHGQTALKKAVKATLFVVVPGMAFLQLVSPILLGLFGSEYLAAKKLLLVLICAAPFDAAMRLLVTYWRVEKATVTLNMFCALWAAGIVGLSLLANELTQIGYAYILGGVPALTFGLIATRFRRR